MAAERLEQARSLLRRLEERASPRAAPGPGETGLLPVAGALASLLPGKGLRRGSTVAVARGPGSTSLLFALLAEASGAGVWAGVVGSPDLGLVAAAEAGIRLERLALVPRPGRDLVAVVSALLDGLDVVVVGEPRAAGVRAGDRQRLAARARQRGAVLLVHGPWPGADLELGCTQASWEGGARGAGRLRTRRVEVYAAGRGCEAGRRTALQLPGPDGRVVPAEAGGYRDERGLRPAAGRSPALGPGTAGSGLGRLRTGRRVVGAMTAGREATDQGRRDRAVDQVVARGVADRAAAG